MAEKPHLRLPFGSEYAIFDAIFWEVMRMEVNVLHIRLGFARKTAENMLFSAYLTGTESALQHFKTVEMRQ